MFGARIIRKSLWMTSSLSAIFFLSRNSKIALVSSLQIPCSLKKRMGSKRTIIGRTFAVGPHDASGTLPVEGVQTKQRQLAELGDETYSEDYLLLPRNSQKNARKATTAATASLFILPISAVAGTFSDQLYNPDNFKPVCAASDSFYRFLQGSTQALVGMDNFVEYGPLISGGLLRVRLELCVVESFFSEAVGPFISRCLRSVRFTFVSASCLRSI